MPGGAAPPEGDAEGTRGGGKQRTSRENVVRCVAAQGTPQVLSADALDDPDLLETSV